MLSTFLLVFQPIEPGDPSPEDPEVASSTADALEQQRVCLWQKFASQVTPSVHGLVDFAKKVPGILLNT
jgi:nuclear receptor subfamily 1 group D protein 3